MAGLAAFSGTLGKATLGDLIGASAVMGGIDIGLQSGSNMLGGLLNYTYNKKLQKQSYKYARRLQKFQHDWQEEMRSTAHQTEVEDLKKAGLNPILSATGGNGAAVPSGSSGTPIGAPGARFFDSPDAKIFDAVSTILQFKNLQSNIALNDAKTEDLKASAVLKRMQTDTESVRPGEILSRIGNERSLTNAKVRNLDAQSGLTRQRELTEIVNTSNLKIDSSVGLEKLRSAIYSNERVPGDITFAVGRNSSIKLENPTYQQVAALSALQSAIVSNDYKKAEILRISYEVRRIESQIRNIDQNTSLSEQQKIESKHRIIQRYIKNISDFFPTKRK